MKLNEAIEPQSLDKLRQFWMHVDKLLLSILILFVLTLCSLTAVAQDTTPPAIASLEPANLSAHIDLDVGDLTMTLDEPVFVGSLAESYDHFQLKVLYGSSTAIQNFEVDDPVQVTVSGTTVTLHNVQTLSYGESYFIYTPRSGIVVDAAGNGLAAMSNNGIWRFTTRKSDLKVVSSFPANGAQFVEPDATTDFTLTFNEAPSSGITTKYAYLWEVGGSSVQSWNLLSTLYVTISGNTVTFKRTSHTLDPGKDYYIHMQPDGFRDSGGRYFEGIDNSETDFWAFSTKTETTPPAISAITPAHDEEGVDPYLTDFTIQFNETTSLAKSGTVQLYFTSKLGNTLVDQTSVSEITYSRGAYTIPFDGHGGLTEGGTYFVSIGNNLFRDSQQNYFEGTDVNNWSFRANRKPTNINLSSSSVLENQPAGTVVGTVSATDLDNGDEATVTLVGGTHASSFQIVGTELRTTEELDYEAGTTRSITLRATDNAGEYLNSSVTIDVGDVDDTPPVLVSHSPTSDEIEVDEDLPYIEYVFDEDIKFVDDGFDDQTKLETSGGYEVKSWYDDGEGGGPVDAEIIDNVLRLHLTNLYYGDLFLGTEHIIDGIYIMDLAGHKIYVPGFSFTTRQALTDNDILSFTADGMDGSATIDAQNHTVTASMSANSTLSVIPSVTLSQGANSVALTNGNPITFESGVAQAFTVTAENSDAQIWNVTLTWPAMAGVFSIGTTGDFANLEAAFAELQVRGMSNDVTFALMDGHLDYKQGFTYLSRYSGSDTYTTTITVEDGAVSASISNYLIFMEGVQNLTIDGKGVLEFVNAVQGNKRIWIRDNDIGEISENITIKNVIANCGSGFVNIYEANNIVIENNLLNSDGGSGMIELTTGSQNVTIHNNEMNIINAGGNDTGIGVGNNSGHVSIINNDIVMKTNASGTKLTGIRAGAYNTIDIYHNTVSTAGTNTQTGGGDKIISFYSSSGNTANVKNNILHYTGTALAIGIVFTGSEDIADNNISMPFNNIRQYYMTDYGTNEFGDGELEDVAAMFTGTTGFDVEFTDYANNDLSLAGISLESPELRGDPVDGVDTDILGNNRSTVAPSKGAYEVPNRASDFITFSLAEQYEVAVINNDAHTVDISVWPDTDVTNLAPTFTISPGASVSPVGSGVARNFTNPLTYQITDEQEFAQQTWTVSVTEGDLPPQANAFSPGQGEMQVLINASVSLGFDEPTTLGTGYIHLYKEGQLEESVDVTSPQVNHTSVTYNSILNIEFTDEFEAETSYSILVDAGVVKDDMDQDFEGIVSHDVWSFTTMDNESDAPVWVYENPEDGAINVSVADIAADGSLYFEFNEPIRKGSGNIQIFNAGNDQLIKTVDVTDENNEVTDEGIDLYGVGLLPTATEVYVLVCDGCITDILGNPYGGNSPGDWSFTTAGPRITGLSPADDAIQVGVEDNLVITFNENVQYSGNSGSVSIYKSDDTPVETIYLNHPSKVVFADNTLTINPDAVLDGSTAYYVQITNTGIEGVANDIEFNGIDDETSWTFTTLDNIAPSIASYDPAINDSKASNFAPITLTMSEDVQLTNHPNDEIRIRSLSNPGTIYKTIDPSSADVTISGNVVTILPVGGILSSAEEVEVYLGWSTTPFEDLAGNDLNELFSTEYRFTVDNIAPTVQSFTPENDAVDVAVNIGQLSFQLSENVVAGIGGKLELIDGSAQVVKQFVMGTADLTISGSTVTLNNVPLLNNNENYWVRNFNAGAARIADLAGNPMPSWSIDTIWEFTTEDAPDLTDPVLSGFSTSGSVALAADLVITYDEPVQVNSGSYVLRDGSGQLIQNMPVGGANVTISGNTVILNPTNNLIYHTDYNVEAAVGVVTDLSGNPAPAIESGDWTFSAEGIISNLSPADNADDVNPFADLKLTFSKTVVLQTGGSFRMFKKSDDSPVGTIWTFNHATLDGNTVTYDIPMDLDPGVELYMVIMGGIVDEDGNPVDIVGKDTWNFTPVILDQTVTLDPIASKTYGEGPFTFTPATATSGQSITYTSSDENVATVSNNLVTIVGAGTTTIRATQAGNLYYNSAFDEQDLVVAKATQTITFNELTDKTYGDEAFTLSATASPSGNPVTFEVQSGSAVTRDGDELTIVGTGDVTIRASSAETANYLAADVIDRDFTVHEKMLSVTVDDKSKTYGEINPVLTFMIDGFAYDETQDVIDVLPSISTLAETNSDVGFYDISLTGGSDDNYTLDLNDGQLEIIKKELQVTADDKSREYGESNPGLSRSFGGFIDGENASDLSGTLPAIATSANANSAVGTYDITLTGGTDANYQFVNNNGTLTVTTAQLDVYAVSLIKNYGDDNPELSIDYDGFKNGEDESDLLTLPVVSTDAGKYSDAGSHPITVSGGSSDNYDLNYIDGSLVIGKVSLTATAEDKSRVYGAGNPEFTIVYSGFVPGEDEFDLDVLPLASTIADENSNVGTYDIDITADEDTNYEISTNSGTLTINQATQTIEITDITDKVKSANPFDVEATVDSGMELNYSVSGPATNVDETITLTGAVGTVTVTVSASASTNYLAASEQTTFEVNDKESQTITFTISDQIYGDQVTLNGSASSGLDVSYEIISGPVDMNNGVLTFTGTGEASIKATQAGDAVYNEAEPVTVIFNIEKADLTVTADDQSFVYGGSMPELTFAYSGFVNGEDADDLSETPAISTLAEASSDAGTYAITLSGGSADNYEITLVEGTMTIEKADPVISVTAIDDKVASDDPFTVEATIDSDQTLLYAITGVATISDAGLITLDGDTGMAEVTVSAEASTNYNAASEQVSFAVTAVELTDQTIILKAIDDKLTTDNTFEVEVSTSSGLEVTLTITGPATLEGNTITLDGTSGLVTVFANQSGNEVYAAAEEQSISFEVDKATQTITIAAIDDMLTTDGTTEVVASASSNLAVELAVTGPATIDGNTITLDGTAGTVIVFANQSGNDTYEAADEVSISFEVSEPDVLAVDPDIVKVKMYPNPATHWLALEGLNGQARVQMINTKGRIVLDENVVANDKISVTHLQAGLYMVQTIKKNITTTTKILIHR